MSELLDKAICLKLNSVWSAIGIKTVRDAFTDLTSIRAGESETSALAMDLDFAMNADGTVNFDEPIQSTPTEWADWLSLPIRPFDLTITTSRGPIRVPTIIISRNYSLMPMKKFKAGKRTVAERDRKVCQYTGEYAPDGNIDHVVPRDRGGDSSLENMVWSRRDINSRKGNKLNHEAGLKLIRKPVTPRPQPVSATIREAKHPSWKKFLIK